MSGPDRKYGLFDFFGYAVLLHSFIKKETKSSFLRFSVMSFVTFFEKPVSIG